MARGPSEETKIKQKRGIIGEDYKAWIQSQEFSRDWGTATTFTDWKTGREMHFLSVGEFNAYLILRFDDKVSNIYEQFPLDKEETTQIARGLGYRIFANGEKTMTTDLLVELVTGEYIAFSIKANKDAVDPAKHRRTTEKQYIEMLYWKTKDIPWKLVFSQDLDRRKANNIKNCASFWDINSVSTKEELFRHLIINRKISVDLSRRMNFADEAEKYIPDDAFERFMTRKTQQ